MDKRAPAFVLISCLVAARAVREVRSLRLHGALGGRRVEQRLVQLEGRVGALEEGLEVRRP